MSITPGAASRSVRKAHPWTVVVVEATAHHVGFRLAKQAGHRARSVVRRLARRAFEAGYRPARA